MKTPNFRRDRMRLIRRRQRIRTGAPLRSDLPRVAREVKLPGEVVDDVEIPDDDQIEAKQDVLTVVRAVR